MGEGTGGGGLQVDYALLAEAANGLNALISDLSGLGIAETGSEGRGFSLLDLDSEGLGVPALQSAFSGFTSRWSWGVRTLVQDGNQFAQRLGLNAGLYYQNEQYLSGLAKDVVNASYGDPHLSSQQVQGESWSQIFGAWKPAGYTKQDQQQIDQINAAELKDIKNGPWWMQYLPGQRSSGSGGG
jgi:hypothetical protein